MTLIKIDDLVKGKFIARPNRYIAEVEIDGKVETVHVHDPGRLKELLYEDNEVLVKYVPSETRKTSWDMIAAKKEESFVLIHSGYHRHIAEAILNNPKLNPFGEFKDLKPEVKYGKSRIDFKGNIFKEDKTETEALWVEVKGCSLSEDGVAKFPDAPTLRGTRHLEELIEIREYGTRSGVLILILSEANLFVPKKDTDPKFYDTFYKAIANGVEIHPIKVLLSINGELKYHGRVPIKDVKNE
ncbi:DNA/RNA nuclease SfsA [Fusibacter bizertensis]